MTAYVDFTAKPGVYRGLPNEVYHRSRGISRSGLSLVAQCPALFHDRVILGNRPEPTPAMLFGAAFHPFVLERDKFDSMYTVAPSGIDRRTKAGKEAYAEFEVASVGKSIISADDFETIQRMSDAVHRHPRAKHILAEGEAEVSVYHTDEATGQMVKVRPDWIHEDLIVDLKSTASAAISDFSRDCFNMGYHMQSAMYLDVANAEMEDRFRNFLFIAVEKKAPFQVAVYVADNEMVAMGRAAYQEALATYVECKRLNRWLGYNEEKIVPISLPGWAASVIARDTATAF